MPHGTSLKESTFGICPGHVEQVCFQFSIMLLFDFMWLLIFARYLSLFVRPTGLVLLFEQIMLVAGIIFRDCEAYLSAPKPKIFYLLR